MYVRKIRAANLSGDCFFWKENFARLKFGWKQHHQVMNDMKLFIEFVLIIHIIDVCKGEGS